LDNDCANSADEGLKTTYYLDADSDSYGDVFNDIDACSLPADYVLDNTDCDDSDEDVNPGTVENCVNSIDDDCDGFVDFDDSTCTESAINLYSGLNLISISFELVDNDVEDVFSSILGNYNAVYTLDSGEWKIFDNTANSNLDKIRPDLGYWVDMKVDDTLFVEGTRLDMVRYNLSEGINLISFPSGNDSNISDEIDYIKGTFASMLAYDSLWLSYSDFKPFNTLEILKADSAIYVNVTEDKEWVYLDGYGYKDLNDKLKYRMEFDVGWNLFSLPVEPDNYSIETVLSSIDGCYDSIWMYNGEWHSNNDPSDPIVSLDNIHGYWIEMNKECTLEIEGNVIGSITIAPD
jgi:hypothetical protein